MRRLTTVTLLLAGGLFGQDLPPIPGLPPSGPAPTTPPGASSGNHGASIRTNAGFSAHSVPRNDDGSSPLVPLGFSINFFGKTRDAVYVNNNGNVTFDAALSTYTPFGLVGTEREIVAAFFSDVDTRPPASKLVTYGIDVIDGRPAFGVNYLDVGYYNIHADKLNSFQLILISRADLGPGNFDIEFNYDRIAWETGDASGGVGGFGGTSAAVGWANGTGEAGTFFELPGSLEPGNFHDGGRNALIRKVAGGVTGRIVYRARDGVVLPPLTVTTACPLANAMIGQPYSTTFTAIGGSQPYRWSLVANSGAALNPGLTFSSDGTLSGTPTSLGGSSFTVRVASTTEDGDQTASRFCSLQVSPPQLSIVTGCPLPAGTAGTTYSQTLSATGGRPPYTWVVNDPRSLPPGLSLTGAGVLNGLPVSPGSYSFQLTASSNPADSAQPVSRICSVTIKPEPVDLTGIGTLPDGTVGVPYSRDLTVQGGTPPYRWSSVGAMPAGFTLSPEGRISGTPDTAGGISFFARVTDSAGNQSTVPVRLMFNHPVLSVIDACPLPGGTTGEPYSYQLSAVGGNPPYTWSVLGSMQAGLALSSDGTLSGIAEGAGAVGFRILVTDSSGNSAAKSCSLPVVRRGYGLDVCPLPPATVGEPYARSLSASGGVPPYLYQTSSPMPGGMSLSSSGRLTGTPTETGAFALEVQFIDTAGQEGSQQCTLPVNASRLSLTSSCPLPQARVGTPYVTKLKATGGALPYSFTASGLPPGLTLRGDGTLSGTPNKSGAYQLELKLIDAMQRFTTDRCEIGVTLPEVPAIRLADLPASLAPASAGPEVTVELAKNYSLAIQGQLNLSVNPDTGASDGVVNRADPRVRFANGQTSADFTIPPGSQHFSTTIASTGTVAGQVVVSASNLKAGASDLKVVPSTKGFVVKRSVPVITDACYSSGANSISAVITGYTTTRQLNTAEFSFGSGSTDTKLVDVSGSALDYFSNDESVRNGGSFTLTVPFTLENTTVTNLSVVLANSEGASASHGLSRCQ